MAIKMRINNNGDAECCECGNGRKKSLEMFDVCIGGQISTICDLCNEQLFSKSLKATVHVNHKLKQPSDIALINKRRAAEEV